MSIADLSPIYFEPEFQNIFKVIDDFTAAGQIDLLTVIPTRHGLWYSIFQKHIPKGWFI